MQMQNAAFGNPKLNIIMVIAQVFMIPKYQGLTSIYRFFPPYNYEIPLALFYDIFNFHIKRILSKLKLFLFFC